MKCLVNCVCMILIVFLHNVSFREASEDVQGKKAVRGRDVGWAPVRDAGRSH